MSITAFFMYHTLLRAILTDKSLYPRPKGAATELHLVCFLADAVKLLTSVAYRWEWIRMSKETMLHIISHTDLDGVASAALAWHANRGSGLPIRVSLSGYGEVDSLIVDSIDSGFKLIVLDLFCQRDWTVDLIDRTYRDGDPPFVFDHHKSTYDRFGNRKWAVIDTGYCAAMVYWRWLMEQALDKEVHDRIAAMEPLIRITNDRDLWLGEIPESRLWQGLVTLCGPWGLLMRLISDTSAILTPHELSAAQEFTDRQEARFEKAKIKIIRVRNDLSFVGDGVLEYGDVSDFCGLILDRDPSPPLLAAVSVKRAGGDWALSLRSRGGLAGKIVSLLRDGKKIRGGGHGDAAALYFPDTFTEDQMIDTVLAAIKQEKERSENLNVTLGDLFKGLAEN